MFFNAYNVVLDFILILDHVRDVVVIVLLVLLLQLACLASWVLILTPLIVLVGLALLDAQNALLMEHANLVMLAIIFLPPIA